MGPKSTPAQATSGDGLLDKVTEMCRHLDTISRHIDEISHGFTAQPKHQNQPVDRDHPAWGVLGTLSSDLGEHGATINILDALPKAMTMKKAFPFSRSLDSTNIVGARGRVAVQLPPFLMNGSNVKDDEASGEIGG